MMSSKTKKILGIVLIVLGIGVLRSDAPPVGVGLLVTGIVVLWRKGKKSHTATTTDNYSNEFVLTDEMIMRLAKIKSGLLTAQELASQTSLNLEQAKQRLDDLHLKNVVELRVTDSGVIVYDFRDNQLGTDDKFNSKRIID